MSNTNNNNNASVTIDSGFEEAAIEEVSLTKETLSLVGPSNYGPAFVPQQFNTYSENTIFLNTFESVFGKIKSLRHNNKTRILAEQWLSKSDKQLSYTRVLGIGDGTGEKTNGIYNKSGFTVGDLVTSGSIDVDENDNSTYGKKGKSKFTNGNDNGRTYFFGKVFVNEVKNTEVNTISPYKDYLNQIGFTESKVPMVTNVIMSTYGAEIKLRPEDQDEESNHTSDSNSLLLIKNIKNQRFLEIDLPDSKIHGRNTNNICFDEYYSLQRGHLNYASFNEESFLKVTSTEADTKYFCIKSANNNSPNYESFNSIFTKAKTPWVVSQPIDGFSLNDSSHSREDLSRRCVKLFRFHAHSDGESGNNIRIKISPERIGLENRPSQDERWSHFGIKVSKFNSEANDFKKVFELKRLNLNPLSENYICKRIGTEFESYDFASGKIVHHGFYRQTNTHIYVEVADDVENMSINSSLMPSGFMPYPRLNLIGLDSFNKSTVVDSEQYDSVYQKPIEYAGNLLKQSNELDSLLDKDSLNWGILFDNTQLHSYVDDDEGITYKFLKKKEAAIDEIRPFQFYSKYFQTYAESVNDKFWIHDLEDNDVDTFNSFFHLSKIRVVKDASNKIIWPRAYYQRDASVIVENSLEGNLNYSYINLFDSLKPSGSNNSEDSEYLSFDFFTYGGFDGVDIFDYYKKTFSEYAVSREYEGEIEGETKGQTYYAYKLGHDLASSEENCNVDYLCIPGVSTPDFCRYAHENAKEKNEYIYLFDMPQYDIRHSGLLREPFISFDLSKNDTDPNFISTNDEVVEGVNSGLSLSLSSFEGMFLVSKNSSCAVNHSLSVYRNDDTGLEYTLELPPTIPYVFSILNTEHVGVPIDSSSLEGVYLNTAGLINSSFNSNNNGYDILLNRLKSVSTCVNPLGTFSGNLQMITANMKVANEKTIFKLHHNVRIYQTILREIKNILFYDKSFGIGGTFLFNHFPNSASTNNIVALLNIKLRTLLNNYKSLNIIKDFIVNISLDESSKSFNDKLNNIFRGKVGISFFGESDSAMTEINLNNIMNDLKDFTGSLTLDIINPNNIL